MDDFNLILKDLISRDLDSLNVSSLTDNMKLEFEKTAETYIKNKNYLDAIKVFVITGNKNRLILTGNMCLNENRHYEAFYAFYYSESKNELNKIGERLLQIPDVKTALKAFKKAENSEMTSFIEANLI
ncbi:hypothetical protein J4440_02135 [Candidatus Woesearchaeota archaeon]|nr:hypothetical protein [Candidatus Woesearchaeota archaeon]